MKTVIVTGLLGSGKSAVCDFLRSRGVPVYDSDRETKALYSPALTARLEEALGVPLAGADGQMDRARLAALIFSDATARESLEAIVYPLLRQQFEAWRAAQKAPFVVLESAVILSKPQFDGLADAVVLVTAPEALRLQRAAARDGASPEALRARMAAQPAIGPEQVTLSLVNDGSPEQLYSRVNQVFFDKKSYLCKLLNS